LDFKLRYDPTYDYGSNDLTIKENLVFYKFSELIKNLYTLASDAGKQLEIIGIGSATEEMVIDFDTYFTLSFSEYIEHNLLTDSALDKLKQLDLFFEDRSRNESSEFWDNSMIDTNIEWAIVREKAKEIIQLLGMQNLILEYDRDEKIEKTSLGNQAVSQTTKVRLVKQNAD
jgi:hypothetical protein